MLSHNYKLLLFVKIWHKLAVYGRGLAHRYGFDEAEKYSHLLRILILLFVR